MALHDTADILARAKRRLNRPTTDEALADTDWYAFFTEAQARVVSLLATHCPQAMYGAPTLLTTSDGGLTYTFGTDSGLPTNYQTVFPVGHVELRASRSGTLFYPGNDWDTGDVFIMEGDKIRWPNGRARTFTDGPYARFITPPGVIDASTQPTLEPVFARVLIVDDGITRAAGERLKMDPAPYEEMFQRDWAEVLGALKTQYFGAGVRALGQPGTPWFRRQFGFTR